MIRTRTLTFCLPAALVLCSALSATAQQQPAPAPRSAPPPATTTSDTPTYELSGGYQYLHVPDQSFPFGLNVDGARHYGSLGLVAEIGWAHGSDDSTGFDSSFNAWNYGVGGRYTGFSSGRVWPYGQVIIGAETLHTSVDVGGVDVSDSETSFMLQPGVGVTFVVSDGFGIFGQVDYRRTFFDEPDDAEDSVNNQFRVFVGARMILD